MVKDLKSKYGSDRVVYVKTDISNKDNFESKSKLFLVKKKRLFVQNPCLRQQNCLFPVLTYQLPQLILYYPCFITFSSLTATIIQSKQWFGEHRSTLQWFVENLNPLIKRIKYSCIRFKHVLLYFAKDLILFLPNVLRSLIEQR